MKFQSALITEARGSVGGLTASRNLGGLYFRARAVPTNPQTQLQEDVRGAMSVATQRWRDVLTPAQRSAWDTYAAATPLVDSLGHQIQVSGFSMYLRGNIPLIQGGQTPVDAGPTTAGLGDPPDIAVFSVDDAGSVSALGSAVTGAFYTLRLSRPISAGRTPAHEPLRIIDSGTVADGAITFTGSDAWPLRAVGSRVRLVARQMVEGRLSPAQVLEAVVAAA